jgi:hypothetical protein
MAFLKRVVRTKLDITFCITRQSPNRNRINLVFKGVNFHN